VGKQKPVCPPYTSRHPTPRQRPLNGWPVGSGGGGRDARAPGHANAGFHGKRNRSPSCQAGAVCWASSLSPTYGLLGAFVLYRRWYGLNNRRGGMKQPVFVDEESAVREFKRIETMRGRRGYAAVHRLNAGLAATA